MKSIKITRILALNALAAAAIILDPFAGACGLYHGKPIALISAIGLYLFPVSFAVATASHFNLPGKFRIAAAVLLPSLAGFHISSMIPKYIVLSGAALYGFLYLFLIILLALYSRISIPRIVLQSFLAAGIICMIAAARGSSQWLVPAGAGVSGLVLFFVIAGEYAGRFLLIKNRIDGLMEENQGLLHSISRLKQSNEQCRRIIVERDLDLHRLTRHSSLAQLTAGIAHELAQPLTGIKSISQNMMDDINSEEFDKLQAVSELAKISALVDKSSGIIERIRNFSRKKVFSRKPVALNDVVIDSVELIGPQLKKNEIKLLLKLDESSPKIHGDKIFLEQLILNLTLNSRDAIVAKRKSEQSVLGEITIFTRRENSSVTLSIQDNGTGIPDEIMQKIWSPFFTTKNLAYGTGIGLSISRKIIKDHDGKVRVTSDTGGTVFTVIFPLLAENGN